MRFSLRNVSSHLFGERIIVEIDVMLDGKAALKLAQVQSMARTRISPERCRDEAGVLRTTSSGAGLGSQGKPNRCLAETAPSLS